jgi:hypothetical protein
LLQSSADLAVRQHIRAAGRRDLQKSHLPLVLGKFFEKLLVGGKTFGQSLGVVEAIDTNNQLAAHQADRHALHGVLRVSHLRLGDHAIDVDPDGIGTKTNAPSGDLYPTVRRKYCRWWVEAGDERAHIVLRLKSGEIVLAHVTDQLRVVRQQAQDLQVRKGDVQEESDRPVKAQLPQVPAQGNELVVVNPDGIAWLEDLHELAGKLRVNCLVRLVLTVLVCKTIRKIMEERPKCPVAVAVVVSVELGGSEVDGCKADVSSRYNLWLLSGTV